MKQMKEIKEKIEIIAETFSIGDIEKVIAKNDVYELSYLSMALLRYREQNFVERVCLCLSSHENETVRGNAILTFGHIAGLYKKLIDLNIIGVVGKALCDESEYVRGQANCAADDLEDFLGCQFGRSLE